MQISRNCYNHVTKNNSVGKECGDKFSILQKEKIEIDSVPESLEDEILEENDFKALSLTGANVTPEQLDSCHHLKKRNHVIVKFKCRKQRQNVLFN